VLSPLWLPIVIVLFFATILVITRKSM
jgi:hypothetical protein